MNRGILPYSRLGNLVRFELSACDHALERFLVASRLPVNIGTTAPSWKTKPQMAVHLKVTLRTVTSLMRRRILPYIKIGSVVRFDVARVDSAFANLHGVNKRG
jgi:hypothetical protein